MKTFAALLLISSLSSAFAKTRIVEIVPGDKPHEDHMVMWSNGKVTYVSPERAKRLPAPDKRAPFFTDEELNMSYQPTIVESMDAAQTLLNKQRKPQLLQWNIQCYNMAHVRAYEDFKYRGIKSHKMFLFFTKSYIRKYRGKWWFHVTPMVHVKVNGKVEQRILDREWAKTPLDVKTWTDMWMKNKAICPVITKYSTFEQNQETESCYRYPAPMYYWQPIHLSEFEESRQEMTEFHMGQVSTAYARDF